MALTGSPGGWSHKKALLWYLVGRLVYVEYEKDCRCGPHNSQNPVPGSHCSCTVIGSMTVPKLRKCLLSKCRAVPHTNGFKHILQGILARKKGYI